LTVLIGGAQPGAAPIELPTAPLRERVEQIMREQDVPRNAALKQAARERGLTRRAAYEQLLTRN
jgi:hypothetical protein